MERVLMARIENSYPTPIHGVSTLAPRNRARGHAGLQTNLRSDPVAKLTRRPSLAWDTYLLNTTRATSHHSYYRREKEIQFIIESTGTVHGYVDGVKKTVNGSLGAYGNSEDLIMGTINDTTFVVNPTVKTAMLSDTDQSDIRKVNHVNITSALNYSTDFVVNVRNNTGVLLGAATISIPDGVDNVKDADEKRATNAVATEIARQINSGQAWEVKIPNPDYTGDDFYCAPAQPNTGGGTCAWEDNPNYNPNHISCKPYLDNPGGIPNVNAVATGSSVAIWRDPFYDWLEIDIDSGRADNAVAINKIIERVDGLPLYAMPGTRITVQPDPTSPDGTYYLDAITIEGESTGDMQEVIWTETRSPFEPYALNPATMPHTIRYDYDTDSFIVGEAELGWEERKTGDNESVPVPDFVGKTITALGHFQKRLVLVSDNDVSMTRTDNLYDWWKKSAVNLLTTDPISVTSNSTGIDILQHIVEHNRDLLIIASNGQFKIEGTQGITPQTVAMPLTTSQEIQISAPPFPMGTSVYLPINYGTSTGITKYDGNRDQQDIATPITHHVIGYMPGEADILVGSPNLEMLAMTTTGGNLNEVYIYEQFTENGKQTQTSWSTWTLPEGNEVLAMSFRRDKLELTIREGNNIILKSINMYSRVAVNTHEVFLDDFLTLSTDGLTCTLPSNYDTHDLIVVMGEGTIYPLEQIGYERSGQTLTFREDIGAGTVYVGSKFYSAYQPTRPFIEDGQGIAVTTDRVRVGKFILNVVETDSVKMRIDSEYFDAVDQEITPRVMNRYYNVIGEVTLFTGDYRFSFSQDADLATATFYSDGYLGMTIAGISWEGQWNKSSRRLS